MFIAHFCVFPYLFHTFTNIPQLLAFSNFQLHSNSDGRAFSPFGSRGSVLCARMSGAFSGSLEETGSSTGLPSTESTESEVEFPVTDDETFLQERDQQIVKILQDYHFGISAQINCGDAQKSNCGDAPSNYGDVPRNCGDDQHGHNCRRGILMFWSGVIFLLFDHLWPLPGPAIKARTARNFLSASVLAADLFSPQSNLATGKMNPSKKSVLCSPARYCHHKAHEQLACRGQKRRDSLSIKKLDPGLKEAAERLFKEATGKFSSRKLEDVASIFPKFEVLAGGCDVAKTTGNG